MLKQNFHIQLLRRDRVQHGLLDKGARPARADRGIQAPNILDAPDEMGDCRAVDGSCFPLVSQLFHCVILPGVGKVQQPVKKL